MASSAQLSSAQLSSAQPSSAQLSSAQLLLAQNWRLFKFRAYFFVASSRGPLTKGQHREETAKIWISVYENVSVQWVKVFLLNSPPWCSSNWRKFWCCLYSLEAEFHSAKKKHLSLCHFEALSWTKFYHVILSERSKYSKFLSLFYRVSTFNVVQV